MKSLVGYTGFVGSNIVAKCEFDNLYNSKNIEEAFGTNPDLLIYAGLRAEKYLANNFPEKDMDLILEAENNITCINPKKLVLISTIDVLKTPINVDENTKIDTENLQAYGYNRYKLEEWVREKYPDALIVRLPALFGINLKKNFIYDYINVIPSMLKAEKMEELCLVDNELKKYYELQDNGFYKLNVIEEDDKKLLKDKLKKIGFSALNFTDSRNVYQFYPLNRLWNDIEKALENNVKVLHLATEPISASELYSYLEGKEFVNECSNNPVKYDYKTIYDTLYGGNNGYIIDKQTVLEEIRKFVKGDQL